MDRQILLLPIILPALCAMAIFCLPRHLKKTILAAAYLSAGANLLIASNLFDREFIYSRPWLDFGLDLSLRLYGFSSFILLAAALLAFLIVLYCYSFLSQKQYGRYFCVYLLLTLSMVNGAVLADNIILMLFFWEGLLLTLFAMVAIGTPESFRTASKALIIIGISDLCLMLGIALSVKICGTAVMSVMNIPNSPLGILAFILLLIGALAKSGAMPFHSWIPDAAKDAPLPFMAFMPAALDKLLGIYFLARICLDLFKLTPDSGLSVALMIIGCATIILAVMMALVQKNYKKLLSYHAISQVGYMVLGIGTAVPVGIVGGLFHMINNALYKSGLFLTAGAVEKESGTTDLEELGGLAKKMPVTFICFVICSVSISGVPPFNGFFSKELVYEGALKRGIIFYLLAVAGSFLTAASFLKLGHAVFLEKLKDSKRQVREASMSILVPMVLIALLCVIFGVFNSLPLGRFILPALGYDHNTAGELSGWPLDIKLTLISLVILLAAIFNHFFAFRIKGSAAKVSDFIRYAPAFVLIYDKAEKKYFDPYEIGLKLANRVSVFLYWLDREINSLYDYSSVRVAFFLSGWMKKMQNGNYTVYLLWSVLGMFFVLIYLMY